MRKNKSGKKQKRDFTTREIRLVKAFLNAKKANQPISKGDAAEEAGYSTKNPTQSANQALVSIRRKAPEIMDSLGLSVQTIIEKHLTPLLTANETRVFAHEGKIVDRIDLADNTTRRYATRMAFELQGAFPPQDPQLAAQVGVEVIILDVARPDRSAINVTPAPVQKVAKQKGIEPSGNGAKPDPRPDQ
jgi:hypothetical protein